LLFADDEAPPMDLLLLDTSNCCWMIERCISWGPRSMAMASWISLSTSEMGGLCAPLGFTHIIATSAIFHTDCRS